MFLWEIQDTWSLYGFLLIRNSSLNDLLTVFFATHDPTVRNRQGNDVGTQYRSAIFYSTSEQRKEIEMFIANLNTSSVYGDPIVTEVKPLTVFYPAESYHQNYYAQNSKTSYCEVIINPKLQKVQEQFAQLLKSTEKGSWVRVEKSPTPYVELGFCF